MKWCENLPDVSNWHPRTDQSVTLSNGLLATCQAVQSRIVREACIERAFNIDNYDSGPGLEDVVRQELSKLLPSRYSVDPGVVNDREGKTAGDYEILIRNKLWSPVVKLGATNRSRRFHFPIESIYSAIEVKQTLGFSQLDDAMKKLVKLSRLVRPPNPYGHITENQHLSQLDKPGYILNPLRTSVLATRLQDGVTFRDVAYRFSRINTMLGRSEMVSDLVVLDEGVTWYSIKEGEYPYTDATYMWDNNEPLFVSILDTEDEKSKVFYVFFVHQLGHLTRSVLGVHNIHSAYGDLPSAEHLVWEPAAYDPEPNKVIFVGPRLKGRS